MVTTPKPDYLSRDYTGLRTSLLQYAQQIYPEWQPSSEGDLGLVMVELFSYMGDILSYYTDRAQFENYLPTATQRDSILNLAFMLGYTPNSGTPATGSVPLTTNKGTAALVVPAGTQLTTNRVDALDGPIVFETNADVTLPANPNGTTAAVATAVTEGTTELYQFLGESNGQPGQTFLLPNTGVYRETIRVYVEDGTGTTVVNPGESQVVAREWVRVERLLESEDTDKVFESRFTDESTTLYFGDDINGAIPGTGLRLYATYRHGFGALGNTAPSTVRLINTKGAEGLGAVKIATDTSGVFQSSAMIGGADPETNESIRYNAPRAYRTQNRIVTMKDYRDAALGAEGVTKASVMSATFTSVTVFICGSDGGAPSATLQQTVLDRLAGNTLAGVSVQVAAPTFIPVNFGASGDAMQIVVGKTYSNKTVQAALVSQINQYIAALPFGTVLTVSNIYGIMMSVEGVVSVDIDVMARNDSAQSGTVKITPKPWEVFTVGTIYINVTGGVA